MPLHVKVYVNDDYQKTFHIGRRSGDDLNSSINTYEVVVGDIEDPLQPEWDDGVQFTHRYGDGLDVCVIRGIEASGVRDTAADIILDELEFRRHEALIDQRAGGTMQFTLDDAIALIKERWAPNFVSIPREEPT